MQVDGEIKVMGCISDDGKTFIKTVEKEHFCRKHQGFGINYQLFKNRLKKDDIEEIKVIYTKEDGTEEVYIASLTTWLKKGTVDKLGSFPKQIFLSESGFDEVLP